MAMITSNDGSPRVISVARAIASTFLGKPPKGHVVKHNDQETLNDRVDNIRWSGA
ncbi:hypothetical protein ATCVCanal1_644L [Acanthocystis turfacea Chlorella virus Canal-1]|nr:hypothetical protein ATCVCanal1_644L [Acanthocystis turfacea Chlorella virus Canal-1]